VPSKIDDQADVFQALQAGIRFTDERLAKDPGNAQLHHERARVYHRLVGAQWAARQDLRLSCLRAIESASESLRLAPGKPDPLTLQVLADCLTFMGEEQQKLGEDPLEWWWAGARAYDWGVAESPRDGGMWSGRCWVLRLLGEWLASRGEDSTKVFASAIESGNRAIRYDRDLRGHYDLALANLACATWLVGRGSDPGETVDRALEFVEILEHRELNSAEAGWLLARDRDALRQWVEALDALATALRSFCHRERFRALSEKVAKCRARAINAAGG